VKYTRLFVLITSALALSILIITLFFDRNVMSPLTGIFGWFLLLLWFGIFWLEKKVYIFVVKQYQILHFVHKATLEVVKVLQKKLDENDIKDYQQEVNEIIAAAYGTAEKIDKK